MANLSNLNNKFIVEDSGDVGIGVTFATTKLHIGGTAPGDSIIRQDSTVSGTNWEIGERAAGKWQIFEDDGDTIVTTFMSTGKVGIGTDSPDARLHIYGSASLSEMYLGEDAAADKAGILKYTQGDGSGTGVITLSHWGNNSLTEGLAIKYGGNVGIGTTNPSGVKFQSVQTTSGEWTGDFKNYTANGYGLRVDMSGSSSPQAALQVYTGSGTGFVVKNSGNVGIGTFTPTGYKLVIQNTSEDMLKLHNSTDGLDSLISFTNPGGTLGRIQGLDNGGLQFDTGNNAGGLNTDVMVMSSGGKVGIGTTGPATKLTVKGATQFGGNSTSTAALTSEFSAYGTTQNLYSITLQEGAVWSPGIAVINFAASRSGLQKHYAGQIIVRLTYYNLSGVAGQGGWAAPSAVGAVVAYSGQAETYMRVYVNGSNTGNPQTIQIGVRDIDDTTNYFVSDIRVTLRSGALTITS